MQQQLFPFSPDSQQNQLPYDGELYHYGQIFDAAAADGFFQRLLNEIAWQHDEVVVSGKHVVTARKIAWYGECEYEYTYSGISRRARLWTPLLREIQQRVEAHTGCRYNSCLLNLYHDGSEGLGWHSDDEKTLAFQHSIASLSLGATRTFAVKHKRSRLRLDFPLAHGELLAMRGSMQQHWVHSVPATKKVQQARINLTFRRHI